MNVYAISDLHLSIHCPKPMDIFGGNWENYVEQIETDWRARVGKEDVVLIGGDTSWAMTLEEALPDLAYIGGLPGRKVLVRGNHDYWWSSISRVRASLAPGCYALQNDALKLDGLVVAGSRGWTVPERAGTDPHDEKIYLREAERMRLSLNAARKLGGEEIAPLVLMHYPPFNVRREDSLFTNLFHEFGVKTVVYGHLHGTGSRTDLAVNKGGIGYYLTSCDQVANRLVKLI